MRAAWLTAIPTLIILCLAAVPGQQAGPGYIDNNAPQLEGSWLVTVTLDLENGPPPFEVLQSYCAGGVVIGSDPSVFPALPMTTAFHGTWTHQRGRVFAFTAMEFQYDDTMDPPVLWKGVVKETVTLEPGGDAYNSKGTVEWYYPDGTFGGAVEDTTHGIRIKAE